MALYGEGIFLLLQTDSFTEPQNVVPKIALFVPLQYPRTQHTKLTLTAVTAQRTLLINFSIHTSFVFVPLECQQILHCTVFQ